VARLVATSTAVAQTDVRGLPPWPDVVRTVRQQMRSLVGAHRDLDDLTQVALERLLRGISGFDGRSELSTFTYRICLRVAMNQWRGWRRWLRRFELGFNRSHSRFSCQHMATRGREGRDRGN
jgi:DNA-directed RNA polymerase specialized sigma24 family protein